ncbi:MAG: DUF2182 domain-containing protein, partial [Bradyrhizobium sp.]
MPQRSMASPLHILGRDRLVVLTSLVAVVALAWGYLAYIALRQPAMDMAAHAMAMMPWQPWDTGHYLATLAMWMAMMTGMMVPSAAPTILLFDALQRHNESGRRGHRPTALFAAGYGLAWSAFSIAATTAQWGLSSAMLLSPMMMSTSSLFAGLLLVAAGAYQLTAWKRACLRHCRSPAGFLVKHRQGGKLGPLMMGLRHGIYCIGCCWALMALLFV